jgi:hypothetical protein
MFVAVKVESGQMTEDGWMVQAMCGVSKAALGQMTKDGQMACARYLVVSREGRDTMGGIMMGGRITAAWEEFPTNPKG